MGKAGAFEWAMVAVLVGLAIGGVLIGVALVDDMWRRPLLGGVGTAGLTIAMVAIWGGVLVAVTLVARDVLRRSR